MKTSLRLIAVLLIGLVALSGCSAVRTLLSGGVQSSDSSAGAAEAEPAVAQFTLYDSWASW